MASTQVVRRLDTERNFIHVSAEELQIEHGHNPEYWEMVPNHDTALFSKKLARLITVCWFDVKGKVVCSLPAGTYTVSWRAKLNANAYGWEDDAVNFTFSKKQIDGEKVTNSSRWKCYLQGSCPASPEPKIRDVGNGWKEYDVGEFAVGAGEHGNSALEIALLATGGNWKTDLSLDGIFIRQTSSSAGAQDAAGGLSHEVQKLDTERNCIHVSAEELQIEHGHNPEYWEMKPNHDTALFSKKLARCKTVCWFDVKGKLLCSLPPGTYTVSWRAKLSASTGGGWEDDAVNFTFSEKQMDRHGKELYDDDEMFRWKCYLQGPAGSGSPPELRIRYVGNGWAEYDVGDFAVEGGNWALEIAMLATGGNWKSDLFLDGIFIRPILSSGSAAGVQYAAGGFSNQVRRLVDHYGTERNCIHVSAEELEIEWGNDPRYWGMVPNTDPVLYPKKLKWLKTVCWFDVKGWVVCSLPAGSTYTVSWRLYLHPSADGWQHGPVNFTFSKKRIDGSEEMRIVSREEVSRSKCYFQGSGSASPEPKIRDVGNGWKEYDVGELVVGAGEPGNFVLEVAMLSTSGFWKSNLYVDGIFIRPKSSTAA